MFYRSSTWRECGKIADIGKRVNVNRSQGKKERGKGGKPTGKMSALDAAHEILKEQNRAMNVKEITELAIASGRWSPNGKTPTATLSAAVQMEVIKKGEASRFIKTGRGLFAAR